MLKALCEKALKVVYICEANQESDCAFYQGYEQRIQRGRCMWRRTDGRCANVKAQQDVYEDWEEEGTLK